LSKTTIESARDLALRLAEIAFEKKAFQLRIYEVRDAVGYTDCMVVCSGRSDRQVQAISDHIAITMKKADGIRAHGIEGADSGQWVLMDYSDVIVHIFNAPVREYYDLDGMFQTAKRVPVDEPPWEEEMRESIFEQGLLSGTSDVGASS